MGALTGEEWNKWREFCLFQLQQPEAGANILLSDYIQKIKALQEQNIDATMTKVLLDYAHDKIKWLDIDGIRI